MPSRSTLGHYFGRSANPYTRGNQMNTNIQNYKQINQQRITNQLSTNRWREAETRSFALSPPRMFSMPLPTTGGRSMTTPMSWRLTENSQDTRSAMLNRAAAASVRERHYFRSSQHSDERASTANYGGVPNFTRAIPERKTVPANRSRGEEASTPPISRKRIAPSKKIYRERRLASRLIERIEQIPEECRTEKNLSTLSWARGVLEAHSSSANFAAVRGVWRQQSVQEPFINSSVARTAKRKLPKEAPAGKAKRTRSRKSAVPKSEKRNDPLKDKFVVAIVDRSSEDGAISQDQWKVLQTALLSTYMEVLDEHPGPPPIVRDAGWLHSRIKLVACADQRSVQLYKLAIERVGELWPNAMLAVVSKDKFAYRPQARSWIPKEPSDPETIMQLLMVGNAHLNTSNWEITAMGEEKGNSRHISLLINLESIPQLVKSDGIINYGFGSIKLQIYEQDKRPRQFNIPVDRSASVFAPVPAPVAAFARALRTATPNNSAMNEASSFNNTFLELFSALRHGRNTQRSSYADEAFFQRR